jgi:hypothetical protein
MSAKPKVTYDESLNLVEINSPYGLTLTPNQTYDLYLALRAILVELPQPLIESTL